MSEQFKQDLEQKAVQTPKKQRTPEEKYGRFKWNQILLSRVLDEIKALRQELRAEAQANKEEVRQIKVLMRRILYGFKGLGVLRYSLPLLEEFACQDQVDVEILELIHQASARGVFPKDVAKSLQQYGLKYYDVSRRIVRMNKRLKLQADELLFEKRGHRWALSSFASEAWGSSENRAQKGGENDEFSG